MGQLRNCSISRTGDVLIGSIPQHARLDMSNCSRGVAILACAHASSCHALHGQFFTQVLRTFGIGTLLLDLMPTSGTRGSSMCPSPATQISAWITEALHWLQPISPAVTHPIGLIGFHEAATAAVLVAEEEPDLVSALVAIQGRPCLLSQHPTPMRAPALLITDHCDQQLIDCNRTVMQTWTCERKLKVVPYALELGRMSLAWNIAAGFTGHWLEQQLPHVEPH